MRVEEEHLFPLFERKTGKSAASMRREHSPIAQAMDAIRAALAVGDQAAFRRARALLENVLGPHNRKEEASLYRALDKLLMPVEREAFVRKLAGLT
jgi:hemerythrin-like domain-containing protein